jgi:hypothetical protein
MADVAAAKRLHGARRIQGKSTLTRFLRSGFNSRACPDKIEARSPVALRVAVTSMASPPEKGLAADNKRP